MQVELKTPELEHFIEQQVRAGHFPSANAAVEAAVREMMSDSSTPVLTHDDLVALEQAEDEIERGEVVEFDQFAAKMRAKFGIHK